MGLSCAPSHALSDHAMGLCHASAMLGVMDPTGPSLVPTATGFGDEGQPPRDFEHDLRETLITYIEVGTGKPVES